VVVDDNQPLGLRIGTRLVAAYENGLEWARPAAASPGLLAPSVAVKLTPTASLVLDYEWAHRNEEPVLGMMPNTQITSLTGAPSAANFPNLAARSREQRSSTSAPSTSASSPRRRSTASSTTRTRRLPEVTTSIPSNAEFNVQLGAHWTARANYNYNHYKDRPQEHRPRPVGRAADRGYRSTALSLFDYLTAYLADPAGTWPTRQKTSTVTLSRRKRLQSPSPSPTPCRPRPRANTSSTA